MAITLIVLNTLLCSSKDGLISEYLSKYINYSSRELLQQTINQLMVQELELRADEPLPFGDVEQFSHDIANYINKPAEDSLLRTLRTHTAPQA